MHQSELTLAQNDAATLVKEKNSSLEISMPPESVEVDTSLAHSSVATSDDQAEVHLVRLLARAAPIELG